MHPSSHSNALGWPARNALVFLAHSPTTLDPPVRRLRIISRRESKQLSCVVQLPEVVDVASPARPAVVGWEKNGAGKLGPRMADLAPLMDPTRCAFPHSLFPCAALYRHLVRTAQPRLVRRADTAPYRADSPTKLSTSIFS